MHKHLNKLGLAGAAAALAMAPALASAQTAMPGTAPGTNTQQTPPMNRMEPQQPMAHTMRDQAANLTAAEQQSLMEAWPADKQAAFKTWPPETQAYFWSLSPERQNIFWALADADKVRLGNMPEQQRESVWGQLEARASQISQN